MSVCVRFCKWLKCWTILDENKVVVESPTIYKRYINSPSLLLNFTLPW